MSTQSNNFDPTRKYSVTFNGANVPIEIELEDNALSQPQRDALQFLLSLPPDVLETAAPAVVQNYEVYREDLGDEELPPLSAPSDVWKLVSPTYFEIPLHYNVPIPTFFLVAECDWDPEHGLMVRFRNGRADAADQQGELGLED